MYVLESIVKVCYDIFMSIFFHIDVNSAFLSWSALEKLHNGSDIDLRQIPSIIGGDAANRHGIVLAKSIPAKAYGIQTAEPISDALKKCPNLTIEPPNHTLYHQRSQELMELLSGICPDIEQVSIDECYMDYTPISATYSSPISAATYIKDQVFSQLGFTVNVGISDRKVLAKMASDFKKPNLVHTLFCSEIREKMWPLPISSLYMCGRSSVETLHKLGILTIGDLASSDVSIISAHLKTHGTVLWSYANGIDDSSVRTTPMEAKGIGNSTTMATDALTLEEIKACLLSLSESVSTRLRKAHVKASMVSVEIKYNTFQSVSHQTTLSSPTHDGTLLYHTACKLATDLWNGTPVRLLGIRTSKLCSEDTPTQLSLFDLQTNFMPQASIPHPPSSDKKNDELNKALDQIRNKYGKNAIIRGSLLPSPPKKDS